MKFVKYLSLLFIAFSISSVSATHYKIIYVFGPHTKRVKYDYVMQKSLFTLFSELMEVADRKIKGTTFSVSKFASSKKRFSKKRYNVDRNANKLFRFLERRVKTKEIRPEEVVPVAAEKIAQSEETFNVNVVDNAVQDTISQVAQDIADSIVKSVSEDAKVEAKEEVPSKAPQQEKIIFIALGKGEQVVQEAIEMFQMEIGEDEFDELVDSWQEVAVNNIFKKIKIRRSDNLYLVKQFIEAYAESNPLISIDFTELKTKARNFYYLLKRLGKLFGSFTNSFKTVESVENIEIVLDTENVIEAIGV